MVGFFYTLTIHGKATAVEVAPTAVDELKDQFSLLSTEFQTLLGQFSQQAQQIESQIEHALNAYQVGELWQTFLTFRDKSEQNVNEVQQALAIIYQRALPAPEMAQTIEPYQANDDRLRRILELQSIGLTNAQIGQVLNPPLSGQRVGQLIKGASRETTN